MHFVLFTFFFLSFIRAHSLIFSDSFSLVFFSRCSALQMKPLCSFQIYLLCLVVIIICVWFLLKYTWEMQTFPSIDSHLRVHTQCHKICSPLFRVEKMIIAFYASDLYHLYLFVMSAQQVICSVICAWHRNENVNANCVWREWFVLEFRSAPMKCLPISQQHSNLLAEIICAHQNQRYVATCSHENNEQPTAQKNMAVRLRGAISLEFCFAIRWFSIFNFQFSWQNQSDRICVARQLRFAQEKKTVQLNPHIC